MILIGSRGGVRLSVPVGWVGPIKHALRSGIDAACGGLVWAVVLGCVRTDASPGQPVRALTISLATLAVLAASHTPRVHQPRWRYFSPSDLAGLLFACTLATGLLAVLSTPLLVAAGVPPFPPRAFLLFALLLPVFLGGVRCLRRVSATPPSAEPSSRSQSCSRVLMAGRLCKTIPIARMMASREARVVAFFDPSEDYPSQVDQIPVYTRLADIERLGILAQVDRVLLFETGQPGAQLSPLVRLAAAYGTRVHALTATSPAGLPATDSGDPPVALQDFLSHRPTRIDARRLVPAFAGRRILVTGAGGSIGSEICRQILPLHPARIVLLDLSENSLCYLRDELEPFADGVELETVVGDIRDRDLLQALLSDLHPEIVLHAAARKHVNLMEDQPEEAVDANIRGTVILAESCAASGVEKLVLVSTDKAVCPTSVMGATKALAERCLSRLTEAGSGTQFVVVRLGNVLGSEGSVLQLFQRQISDGRPITITHPDTTRYFIDICEAVHLILRAAMLGGSGRIYMLDMGEPVRILDLARNLAAARGVDPDLLPITVIGLRPGERLHEELREPGEEAWPLVEPGLRARQAFTPASRRSDEALDRLLGAARTVHRSRVLALLHQALPSYTPSPRSLARARTGLRDAETTPMRQRGSATPQRAPMPARMRGIAA